MDDIEFLAMLAQSDTPIAIRNRGQATLAARLHAEGLVHWREDRQSGSDIRGHASITGAGITRLSEGQQPVPEEAGETIELTILLKCVAIEDDGETISDDPPDHDSLNDFAQLLGDGIAAEEVMRSICEGSGVFVVAASSELVEWSYHQPFTDADIDQFALDESLTHVLGDVAMERNRQDERWGGADHDDGHPPHAWEDLIHKHAYRLTDCQKEPMPDYRERLIKIAALAVAAIQVWDRQQEKEG